MADVHTGIGAEVGITGLTGAPQHNGKAGVVLSYDSVKGRYNVRLQTGETVALKPTNLLGRASAAKQHGP